MEYLHKNKVIHRDLKSPKYVALHPSVCIDIHQAALFQANFCEFEELFLKITT